MKDIYLKAAAEARGEALMGEAKPARRRLFMTAERARQQDWIQMCTEVGQVLTQMAQAAVDSGAPKGTLPHDVVIKHATMLGPIFSDMYNVGYVDGQGARENVGIIKG